MKDRTEFYIIPENFKKGKFILNRFRVVDLLIIILGSLAGVCLLIGSVIIASQIKNLMLAIAGISIALIIIFTVFVLTLNLPYYHNVLGKFICFIRFHTKTHAYKWKGVDYVNYEEERKQES